MILYPVREHLVDGKPRNYIGPYIILKKLSIGPGKEIWELQLPYQLKFSKKVNGKLLWTQFAFTIHKKTVYAG